jgi:hypothetical protein
MDNAIAIMRKTRTSLLALIKDLSLEQLNTIPKGFNNNIIWNVGHLVAAQQGVCYRRAGLPLQVDEAFFAMYKPESKPERSITQEEVDQIKEMLFSTLEKFEDDYPQQRMADYPAWVTRYGVNINCLDDAVNFLPFHEGLHLGYVMALKRLVVL